jgi:photosystem II stability/assembly factor-like uncharacterized protein
VQGRGLPTREVGKVKVAFAPSNPSRIYALIETGDGIPWGDKETDRGQVWRSNDRGETWQLVSYDRNAGSRAAYYAHMFVAPDNENEVYFLTSVFSVSIDGGKTLNVYPRDLGLGHDFHDMWIDPTNANRMVIGNDVSVSFSVTRGRTWVRQPLPNAQMYHVTVDNQIPYYVYGGRQDGGGTYGGPSNSRLFGDVSHTLDKGAESMANDIPRAMWGYVGGGESGWPTPDPVDHNLIWSSGSGSGSSGGLVVLYEQNRGQARNVEVWSEPNSGPPADLKYRINWVMPLTISPHDPKTVYVGTQHVHRTTNRGQSWEVISPDLSTNDKSRQQSSGGITPENGGVEYGFTVMAIAESRLERGLIWAGTNDGQVQLTRDNGKTWTNVTKNIPNLPASGTVRNIEPSRYDAATAYLTVDLHQENNRDPWVYKTTDYGKTWRAITNGIPKSMLSYTHWLTEDPLRRGLLYLGTENAIYVSFDDGEHWLSLQLNLPHAPVYGIVVQEHFNDLVVATYGRGFWILDDITPLQHLTPQVLGSDAHLFPPRPAYRFRAIGRPGPRHERDAPEHAIGENPPYGAAINYYLKAAPSGNVTITILDQKGQVVRTLQGTKNAGINRVYWDLHYEPTKQLRLRTSPLYAPEVQVGPEGWRPATGQNAGRLSILAAPGTYTVQLSVGGRQSNHKVEVRKDPHSGGGEGDIQQQMKVLFELRRDLDQAADLVNQVELVRSQIYNLARILDDTAIKKAGDDLDKKLIQVEENLIELRLTGGLGVKLIGKLNHLANGLMSSDFKPTDQQLEVQRLQEERLRSYQSQFDGLLSDDLAAFNDLLRKRNVSNIILGAAGPSLDR